MKKCHLIILFVAIAINICKAQGWWLYDSISFEEAHPSLYLDTTHHNNIWQIGTPHKTLFNSAHSFPKAIVTDTAGYYPVSDTSCFILKIKPPMGVTWGMGYATPEPTVFFYQKFNTDTLLDGGYVQYSGDGGMTWTNVTTYWNDGPGGNMPGVNIPYDCGGHIPCFNGRWNKWFRTNIVFGYVNPYSGPGDSLLVKFTFVSDGINNNKEGWIIDDIITGTIVGEGIEKNDSNNEFELFPNPANNLITIESKKNKIQNIKVMNVTGKIIYQSIVNDSQSVVDLSKEAKGIYFVKIIDNKKNVINKKIIKQ